MEEDRELIAASREGDHEAFRTIVERHKEGVLGVAMSRVRDFDDAQDVAQVTFVEAYHRLGSLKDGAKLGFWLRSIAHNRAVDAVRSRRRAAEVAAAAEPPGAVPTPHEELEQIEIRDHVWAALERLKKPQREAVILHYLSGYTQEEVATMLDVPVGTVKYRLHEARVRLKKVTLTQVKAVMRQQKTDDDFSDRVLDILSSYLARGRMPNEETRRTLVDIGPRGKEGFLRAMTHPHWRTRRAAVHYLHAGWSQPALPAALPPDEALEVAKLGLADVNRQVRMRPP